MKKHNKLSSVFAYFALTSGTIWFGAYVARLLSVYQMFDETEPVLRDFLNNSNLPAVIQVIEPLISLTFITYIIMVLSFVLFLIFSPLKFKQNGWLFILAAIIFLTLPLETVFLIDDFKLIVYFMNNDFVSSEIIKLITDSITKLGSFPIIILLSYLSIPYLLIFKPFTLNRENEN